ncbi:MAG: hypothetical protein IJP67_06405 [Oscillospiraceae bacterium]|nr:hypothetical protein [Oscillospiraceae bacterium]
MSSAKNHAVRSHRSQMLSPASRKGKVRMRGNGAAVKKNGFLAFLRRVFGGDKYGE